MWQICKLKKRVQRYTIVVSDIEVVVTTPEDIVPPFKTKVAVTSQHFIPRMMLPSNSV